MIYSCFVTANISQVTQALPLLAQFISLEHKFIFPVFLFGQVKDTLTVWRYPGFGQDRVNFHQNPGRGTAGQADPTWPNRAGYSIPCAVTLGSGGGELSGQNSLVAWGHGRRSGPVRSGRAALWFVRFVLCFLLICIVVVTVPFVCCSVKLPLSRPTSFCLFLSILLRTPSGRGMAVWRFCCRSQPNHNIKFGAQCGAGIMAGLSGVC